MMIIQVVCQWSDKHNGTWPQWWRRRVQVDHHFHHHHHHHHHQHHGRCSGWSMSERWLILSLQNVDCSSSTRRILSRRWCSKNKWKKRWEQSWRWTWVWWWWWWWCQWSAHAAWVIFQAKDFVKWFKRRLYRIIIIYGFTKHWYNGSRIYFHSYNEFHGLFQNGTKKNKKSHLKIFFFSWTRRTRRWMSKREMWQAGRRKPKRPTVRTLPKMQSCKKGFK